MLKKIKNYFDFYDKFKQTIPLHFNTAKEDIYKYFLLNRVVFIDINIYKKSQNNSQKFIYRKSDKLAKIFLIIPLS